MRARKSTSLSVTIACRNGKVEFDVQVKVCTVERGAGARLLDDEGEASRTFAHDHADIVDVRWRGMFQSN